MNKLSVNRVLCLLLLVFISQNLFAQFSQKDFSRLFPIQGKWKMNFDKNILTENWIKKNDTLLVSKSYLLTGKDSVLQESVELAFSKGKISYSVTVIGHFNQQLIVYNLVLVKNKIYTFENKEHDFPRQIIYDLNDEAILSVTINGYESGEFLTIPFIFSKIK